MTGITARLGIDDAESALSHPGGWGGAHEDEKQREMEYREKMRNRFLDRVSSKEMYAVHQKAIKAGWGMPEVQCAIDPKEGQRVWGRIAQLVLSHSRDALSHSGICDLDGNELRNQLRI
ncbi:hypothetical protein [Phyllobacterium sp. K27]